MHSGTGTDSASRLTDEWTFNEPGDAAQIGCLRPDVIRISLIARSLTPDTLLSSVSTNIKPAVENGAPGAAADQYRHRVLTTTVFPRNLEGVP